MLWDTGSSWASRELFEAILSGDAAKVRELLGKGVDINARDEDGWTLLRVAAGLGYLEVAKLLEHGADVSAEDKKSRTPADFS